MRQRFDQQHAARFERASIQRPQPSIKKAEVNDHVEGGTRQSDVLYCLNGAHGKTLARNDWAVAEAYGFAGINPHFVRIACPSGEST